MRDAIPKLETLEGTGPILLFVRDFAESKGIVRQSYHFSPVFDAPTSANTVIFSKGYSAEWLAKYDKLSFREHDPIPERTLRFGAALSWQDAMKLEPNSDGNQRYFAAMAEAGLVHGIGLPLFGPGYREAYASYDFDSEMDAPLVAAFDEIRTVAQAAQIRICRLLADQRKTPTLSERERDVSRWIARGKSTSEIGAILAISPETVRTYSKRIYEKLGASNRIGAILRAVKHGLVRL